MRVIAGTAKGRRLKAPRGNSVRPMTDQIREAMFSSLGTRVDGALVLDLYAGSGAVGIEALSRGAARATFVERDGAAAEVIRSNLQATGLAVAATVVRSSVEEFLRSPSPAGPEGYDLVMVDPPFAAGLPSGVLGSLSDEGLLAEGSIVVVRVESRSMPVDLPRGFKLRSTARYGDSTLMYLEAGGEPGRKAEGRG